jgi:hypothetical protein
MSPGHVSLPPEAPVPSRAITVMTGVPAEGTDTEDTRERQGVDEFLAGCASTAVS